MTDDAIVVRMPFGDGIVREVEITADQAAALEHGMRIHWRSPEFPDISVDAEGTITEQEDARGALG